VRVLLPHRDDTDGLYAARFIRVCFDCFFFNRL
jgi:hypothetical protein